MNINIVKLKKAPDFKLYKPLFLSLAFFSAPPLYAADELFFDMPVVLSANRLEQPVADAAVSISIIDRETIEATGARTIPEVLRLIPGMQVGYSGNEFGAEPEYVVAYHGHSDEFSKQMQVLIDGRSIYEPLFGGINWKAIPVNINDIERIEVSRGPNLATYGSNSFQAAINIITRTAAEDQGSFVQTNIGSNEIADLTYRYGGSNGKLDYRITGSSYNDAGLESANKNDYPNDAQSNNIDYRLDYQITNNSTLSYQGGYGRNEQESDRNHDGLIPTARTIENTRLFQFIKWENAIDEKNTLQLQYYYNLYDKEDRSISDPVSFPPLDTFTLDIDGNIKTERHNIELTHFINPNEDFKIVWGLSAQSDYAKAPLNLGDNKTHKNKQYRGFANVEWHLNQNNIVNLGALAEKNDFTDTELSPRISFTHAFNKQHSIRLGISQAIRNPFLYEAEGDTHFTHEATIGDVPIGTTLYEQQLLGGIPGGVKLKNEKIISREIVYYGQFLNTSLLFNARLFHDDITNFIDTVREDVSTLVPEDNVPSFDDPSVNEVRVFQNAFHSTTTGLEIEVDYRIDPTLRLIASGAIINLSSNNSSIAASAPQHSVSMLATKSFNHNYSGSLAYYFVEEFKWTDSRGGTDDYETVDMRISRRFNIHKTNGSISLVLKNLLDDYSDYQETPSNSSAPKVVHSTLTYLDFRLNF